jgi:hypothetical protein
VLVGSAALTSACGSTQDASAAAAASGLLRSAHDGDGAAACAYLAPAVRSELEDTSGKPCAEAILEESLGGGSAPAYAEVFDTAARAEVGPEVLFLSRYDGRWLVIAAACTAVPAQPYDCSVGMP